MTPSPSPVAVQLGCFDADVGQAACQAYLKQVETTTRAALADIGAGLDKLSLQKYAPAGPAAMTVADVQRGLKTAGFFPAGQIDGICGYRTQSAIRLFQEYVRTMEKADDFVPDGRFGPRTQAHLKRWLDGGLKPNWQEAKAEAASWLALLERVKAQYLASPNAMLQKVNAFAAASSTRKVAQWDFDPQKAHLIGVRRSVYKGKFEDIFVLLVQGLVFKFQGSTDPGATEDARGFPFLAQGQHDYHFGWHKKTYLALKPQSEVLVIRSKNDRLDDAAMRNNLETNATINVHWGGAGMARDVTNWSEGCQVINGTVYINPRNDLINCSQFAATGSKQPLTDPAKTRGAYNVLLDLVSTLATDQNSAMRYMLLNEADVELDQTLKQSLDDARQRVLAIL